jgi:hypothetical protein
MNRMDPRFIALADAWRRLRLPSADLSALIAYLVGMELADRFLATWHRLKPTRTYDLSLAFHYLVTKDGARLGRFDERVLELCAAGSATEAKRWLYEYFRSTGTEGPVAAAWDYLLEHGVDETVIWRAALHALAHGLGRWRETMLQTWEGESMQALWEVAVSRWHPEQAATHLAEAYAKHVKYDYDGNLGAVATLALRLDPPDVELAWQVAQIPSSYAGYVAGLLLAHDPARFMAWTRSLALDPVAAFATAGLGTLGTWRGRDVQIDALRALAQADAAGHARVIEAVIPDVAAAASRGWDNAEVVALELAYVADPARHRRHLEALLGAKAHEWAQVLRWLEGLPEEQGRPLLEYAVWHGTSRFARAAMDLLLGRAGDDAIDFAATLLAHPSKPLRAQAMTWLAERGAPARAAVIPLLKARQKAAREAAQEVLARLDAHIVAAQR